MFKKYRQIVCCVLYILIYDGKGMKMYDIYSRVAGMLCDILGLANNKTAMISADHYLKKDMDLISDLLKRDYKLVKQLASEVDDIRWLQCDYILHALFYALREKIPAKILLNSSDEFILQLQDVVNVAKKHAQPTKEETDFAKSLGEEYSRRSASCKNDQLKKNKNNVVRFSSFITLTVARHWDEMVAELNRWSEYIDERVSLGSLTQPKKRQLNLPINPQKWELQSSAGNRTGESPKISDKTGITTNTKEKPMKQQQVPVADAHTEKATKMSGVQSKKDFCDEDLWTIEYLAQKLGLAVGSFHCKKSAFLKSHPEQREKIKNMFVFGKQKKMSFKVKYFEELKQLMHLKVRASAEIVSQGDVDWWTGDKLAHELGLSSKAYFHTLKSKLLKAHPEYREKIEPWFSANAALFNPVYLEELKDLFQMERRNKKSGNGNSEPVQDVRVVVTDNAEIPVDEPRVVIEHPKDLVGITAVQTFLTKLQGVLEQQTQTEQVAKKAYEAAQKQTADARRTVENVQNLLDNVAFAEQNLRFAQMYFDKTQAELNQFLFDNNLLQK